MSSGGATTADDVGVVIAKDEASEPSTRAFLTATEAATLTPAVVVDAISRSFGDVCADVGKTKLRLRLLLLFSVVVAVDGDDGASGGDEVVTAVQADAVRVVGAADDDEKEPADALRTECLGSLPSLAPPLPKFVACSLFAEDRVVAVADVIFG